ncbi:helix-turn-helix domain-containing protein [Magnetococcales bacterium HHB-1]
MNKPENHNTEPEQAKKQQSEQAALMDLPPESLEGTRQIGEMLRQARLRKGWSLEDLKRITRIRVVYLSALENGALDKLPGATFAMGFLKIYAKSVGLPVDTLLSSFSKELEKERHKIVHSFPAPAKSRHRPGWLFIVVTTLLFVSAFIFYEWNYAPQDESWRQGEKSTEVNSELAAKMKVPLEMVAVPELIEEKHKPDTNIPATLVPPAPDYQTKKEANRSTLGLPLAVPPEVSMLPELSPSVADEPVSLYARQRTWIRVIDASGKPIKEKVMRPGDLYILPPGGPFKATLGNAAGIVIRVGKHYEVPNSGEKKGKVAKNVDLSLEALRPLLVRRKHERDKL